MTTTDRDIRDQVQLIVDASEGTYDIDAIARDLVETYDLTGDAPRDTVDGIESGTFWDIVGKHVADDDTTAQAVQAVNAYAGSDVWQDVILQLEAYDDDATEAIGDNSSNRFALTADSKVDWTWQFRSGDVVVDERGRLARVVSVEGIELLCTAIGDGWFVGSDGRTWGYRVTLTASRCTLHMPAGLDAISERYTTARMFSGRDGREGSLFGAQAAAIKSALAEVIGDQR